MTIEPLVSIIGFTCLLYYLGSGVHHTIHFWDSELETVMPVFLWSAGGGRRGSCGSGATAAAGDGLGGGGEDGGTEGKKIVLVGLVLWKGNGISYSTVKTLQDLLTDSNEALSLLATQSDSMQHPTDNLGCTIKPSWGYLENQAYLSVV